MILRVLEQYLLPTTARRLIMIIDARQTAKTTLAKASYPDLCYISLNEIETRDQLQVSQRDRRRVILFLLRWVSRKV